MVFLQPENVELLWEIILDENISPPTQEFRNTFLQGINAYYGQFGSSGEDLIQMNKRFISGFVYYEKQKRQKPPVQRIPELEIKEIQPVLAQDILTSRMNQFERDLASKQNEFNEFMTQSIPEAPKFNDKMDEPIGDSMGDLIARTLAERNQDLEKIHNENAKKQEAEKWLKSENTSVKSINEETSTPIKYIKIGDELSTTLEDLNQAKPKKTLSWSSELDSNNVVQLNNNTTLDIFSKLKTIQQPTIQPIIQPTIQPTIQPIIKPTIQPTIQPTIEEKVDKLLLLMSQLESKIDFLMKQQNTINI
jgi:molybdopterin converting factor small subunit